MKHIFLSVIFFSLFIQCSHSQTLDHVKIYDVPNGVELSDLYQLKVEGQSVPVYPAKIAPGDERRWAAMDKHADSHKYYDVAAFAYFDMDKKPVNVSVTVRDEIKTAKILPSSRGIEPVIKGKTLSFRLDKPEKLTIEINGEIIKSLHIFANSFETDVPDKNDPNVIYFGPGLHKVTHMEIGDDKTVYIAGGAVVEAVIDSTEAFEISGFSGLKTYSPTFILKGKNIKVRGRGILDATHCTTHSRNMMVVEGENIEVEGIIFKDPSAWTIPVRFSKDILIKNIKILGYRANSDGVDICGSFDVEVDDCFMRTLDDLVVIKTPHYAGEAGRIYVHGCVLWNQVAHALSIGAELTKNVTDVTFKDCDIIHDMGREWSLRVYQCDKGLVSNIRFEDIRIEESIKLISLWIGSAIWTHDNERGNIRNITFENIHAKGDPLTVELQGFDDTHTVDSVTFNNITINGERLQSSDIKRNEHVGMTRLIQTAKLSDIKEEYK